MTERILLRIFFQFLFGLVVASLLPMGLSLIELTAISLAANLAFALLIVFLIPIPVKS